MFLTDEDVQRLTGYERTTKQVEWLRANRILHYTNAHNKVIVTADAVNQPALRVMREPDFSKMG